MAFIFNFFVCVPEKLIEFIDICVYVRITVT